MISLKFYFIVILFQGVEVEPRDLLLTKQVLYPLTILSALRYPQFSIMYGLWVNWSLRKYT